MTNEFRAMFYGAVRRALIAAVVLVSATSVSAQDVAKATPASQSDRTVRQVIVIRGASGTAEFGRLFDTWAEHWMNAAGNGGTSALRIGPTEVSDGAAIDGTSSVDGDFLAIRKAIEESALKGTGTSELWIVLIGHGTFDGRRARFNLRGRDVSADDFSTWLESVSCPVAIVNCSSASGPFLKALAGPGRVVVTATKSGSQINFARFGQFVSEAIGDSTFDLDKDGQTSLFEAFLSGSRRTQQFYESEGRLATEHALLDDNGDGMGVRADLFRGVRQVKKVKSAATVDGRLAHRIHLVRSHAEQQLAPEVRVRRDELEQAVVELRDRKATFENEDAYYAALEPLLVKLAQVYE